jgi:hypothetical protein
VSASLFRRSRPGRRDATAALLMLVLGASLSRSSFAVDSVPPPGAAPPANAGNAVGLRYAIFGVRRPLALTPLELHVDLGSAAGPNRLEHLQLAAPVTTPRNLRAADPAGPVLRSLDLSLRYLRLAVHGDHRAGLLPFLGTSTTSLGGLRLRF